MYTPQARTYKDIAKLLTHLRIIKYKWINKEKKLAFTGYLSQEIIMIRVNEIIKLQIG